MKETGTFERRRTLGIDRHVHDVLRNQKFMFARNLVRVHRNRHDVLSLDGPGLKDS